MLLILHGALGAKTQLEPLAARLQALNVETALLDFSGHHGVPFRNSFGIEAFADDVSDFLRSRPEQEQLDIFGYSMGGYVALWYAAQNPGRVRSIVTLGTKFDWSPASAAHEVKKLNPEKILEKVPAFARILEHRHAPNDWKVLLHKTSEMMIRLGNNPLLSDEVLETVDIPTLVLLGDQDDMADRDYSAHAASVLRDGVFKLLDNTAHPIEKVDLDVLLTQIARHFRL